MSAATHPAPRRDVVPTGVLWFGIFGAPAAWALQIIVTYALVAHFCFPHDRPRLTPTFEALRATGIVVSVIVLVVTLLALATAVRSWRAMRHGQGAERVEQLEVGEGRARFMAFAGVLLSAVFLFAVLMNALPLITNAMCMA